MADIDRLRDEEDILRTARELQQVTAKDFVRMVRLLRSKPDGQVLGQAEVNARQQGATKAPA